MSVLHTLCACLPRFGTYISHQLGFHLRSAWHGWKGCKIPSFLPCRRRFLARSRQHSNAQIVCAVARIPVFRCICSMGWEHGHAQLTTA